MKNKILAIFTALTVVMAGSMTAFAASPTVGTTETPAGGQQAATSVAATMAAADYAAATTASEGFTVEAVSETTVRSAAVAAQNLLLNDLASLGAKLGNNALIAAAKDPSKSVKATLLTVVEVSPSTATQGADGNYAVTLSISSISAGDAIAVLHYNGSAWEVIVPTSVAAGSVTFSTPSLSPIAVAKLEVSGMTAAPRTGETMPVAAIIVMAGLVGIAFCGKKFLA